MQFQHGPQDEMLWILGFGVLFTVVGIGLFTGGKIAKIKNSEKEQLMAAYPDEPWKWKKEWANGRIFGYSKQTMLIIWAFALCWNGFSVPLSYILIPRYLAQDNKLVYLILIFPLIGIFIL